MPIRRRPVVLIILALLAVLGSIAAPALAQTKTLEWQRLDTDITVQINGDLDIVETNVIHFTSGTFSFGYRDIDRDRIESIENVRVTDETGQPLRVEVTSDSDVVRIKYFFPLASREVRTFKLYYTVRGALRYYEGGDQVYWAGVYADRNGFPVQAARITVQLPEGVTAQLVDVYGPPARVTGEGESLVVAEAVEPIPSGQELEIRVQFPHGIVQGQPAAWQAEFDRQRAFEETAKPVLNVLLLLVSLLLLFGGPALAVVLWYVKGRDPHVGLIADYLSEPPADISAALAGTLVDERADLRDVIATLVDLARRGVLIMEEQGKLNQAGLLTNRDWLFARGPQFGSPLAPHEQKLIEALQLTQKESIALSSMRNRFYVHLPAITDALYGQLVAQGYYQRRPDHVRGAYTALATVLMVATFFLCSVGGVFLFEVSDAGFLLPIGLGVTALAFYLVAAQMPVRTRKGAEAKMRLEAFKRYLQNIEKYTDLSTAAEQFEKYLPYAIAFGIDRSWVSKFAAVDAPAPTWYVPYGRPRSVGPRTAASPAAGGSPLSDVGGAASASGGLSGLDRGLSQGLAGMNAGLTSMFSSAASIFASAPASSSSGSRGGSTGWSGGGSFRGGSSGRGGGGFG
ncbi:MAG: DUF2207 domain-containing protein [Anaerolineae bacterium]|nr:DUF2207 domain-containing protein [Thermoflexales bacterium]MDW8408509.1 DUF2207 domain-containing protein [Anaerolineae bacterium]